MKMGSLMSSSPLPTSVPTPTPLFDPSNHPSKVVWSGSVQDFLSYLVFSFNLDSWHLCRVQQRKDPVEKNSPHECITLQVQTAAFVPAERWIRLDRYEDSVPEDSDTVRVTVEETALWDDRMSCVVEREVTYHHLPPSYRPPFSRILALLQVIIERYPVYDLAQHGDQWHANVFIKTIATTFPSGRYVYPKRPSKYRSLLGIFPRISSFVKPHPEPANNTSIEDVISKWERCQFLPQQLDKVFLEERYPAVNLTFEVGDAFVSPPGRDKIPLQLFSSHDGSGEDMYTKLHKQLDPGPSQRPSKFGVRFSDRSGLCTLVIDFGSNEDGWSQFTRCRQATEKNLLDAPQDVQVDLKVESTAYLTFSEHSRQVLIHRPTPDTIGQDHLPLTKFVPFDIWQGRMTGNVTYEPPNESHLGKLYSSERDTATVKARDFSGRHSIRLVVSDSGGRTVYEMTFEGRSMWKDRWQMYMSVLKSD